MRPSATRSSTPPARPDRGPPRARLTILGGRGGSSVKVVVTGGSGKGGTWVVRDLREHGHDVLNVDTRHGGSGLGLCMIARLTDLGQTQEALAGADAVVHFAAIPAPGLRPDGETFRIN